MAISVYQSAKNHHLLQNIHFMPLPPGWKQRLDYGDRTDGQPDYLGVAHNEVADSESQWTIYKYTYNDDQFVTLIESAGGSWEARESLFS